MSEFSCPHCGGNENTVYKTLPHPCNVRRRRRCKECGKRFSTEEVVIPCKEIPQGIYVAYPKESTRSSL